MTPFEVRGAFTDLAYRRHRVSSCGDLGARRVLAVTPWLGALVTAAERSVRPEATGIEWANYLLSQDCNRVREIQIGRTRIDAAAGIDNFITILQCR